MHQRMTAGNLSASGKESAEAISEGIGHARKKCGNGVEHGTFFDQVTRALATMILFGITAWLLVGSLLPETSATKKQAALGLEHKKYKEACPDYKHYSVIPHPPLSDGDLTLPFQRPSEQCRTFSSPVVEEVIEGITSRMVDKDLARLFENTFPNTLDTTVAWHTGQEIKAETPYLGYVTYVGWSAILHRHWRHQCRMAP